MVSSLLQCSRPVLGVIVTSLQVILPVSIGLLATDHYNQRRTTPPMTAATRPNTLTETVLIVAGDLANRIASSYPLISLG